VSTLYLGGSLFREGVGSVPGWGVRVEAGRIVSVLPDAALLAERGDAEVVDARGGLISPGFVDAHYHPTLGGFEANGCDLSSARSVDECLNLIAAYAAAHPELKWITGGGWAMGLFPGGTPTKGLLDSVVRDRPVLLGNADHHGHWANSLALELAGVHAGTPDPAGGRIERDAEGNPTGTLHEAAADLVERLVPEAGEDERLAGLLTGQQHAFSFGVTGWQDALVGSGIIGPDNLPVYVRAQREGTLKAQVRLALWWDRDRGLEQIDDLVARRSLAAQAGLDAGAVKIMVDGVAENYTAAVSLPYLDRCGRATTNRGHSFIEPAVLKDVVRVCEEQGFQCHFHALGDRAVTEALDAIEHALGKNGRTGLRHHLAHLQMVSLRDVTRFARLGVAANLQPLWAQAEQQMVELTLPFLDESLRDRQYPFGDLLAAGATLVAGSDWPVSSANPLDGMQVAVTRQYVENPSAPLLPGQALPLERIWTAYTAGSAWVNHREADTGTLTPGKRADLVVLDRDPFALDPHEISQSRVVLTVVGGETVHRAA
jgi:predicted amidohydrolase YtcJ